MKELKKVANMLGTILSKEELDEFMAEADSVNNKFQPYSFYFPYKHQDGNGKMDYDEFCKMMLQN